MNILEISHLRKTYRTPDGAPHVVVDVSAFSLAENDQIALQGESGAGKTTFLNLIAGILRADEGSILINGRDMESLSESQRDKLRARSIGYIFQSFNLLQGYTALENIELAMTFGAGIDAAFARRLLEHVGLRDRMNYYPRQLSVGQQQRVAIARAMANRPTLVLADEPTGNLDAARARDAIALIRELCTESQAALLLVSHDADILGQFQTRLSLAEINRAGAAGD